MAHCPLPSFDETFTFFLHSTSISFIVHLSLISGHFPFPFQTTLFHSLSTFLLYRVISTSHHFYFIHCQPVSCTGTLSLSLPSIYIPLIVHFPPLPSHFHLSFPHFYFIHCPPVSCTGTLSLSLPSIYIPLIVHFPPLPSHFHFSFPHFYFIHCPPVSCKGTLSLSLPSIYIPLIVHFPPLPSHFHFPILLLHSLSTCLLYWDTFTFISQKLFFV